MTYIAIKSKDDCSEALEAARRYSPNIEIVDEKTLVFDVTGSKAKESPQIAKKLREKFASVAVSENLAAALLLALWGREEEFKVQGSKFKVCEEDRPRNTRKERKNSGQWSVASGRSEEITTARSSERQSEPPAVAGGDSDEFKVQGSKFKVCETGFEAKTTSLSEQTLNFELGTLNRLPLEAISRKAEFLELMDSWAVHDLGSFAGLPKDEMVARFGLEIVELLKQAKGEAFRAPNWNVKEDKFFWTQELEGGIETIEPLNFVLSKGVEQIFQNLNYVGLSTQSAKITLGGRGKEKIYRIRIVFPTKNQKLWIRQIVTKIELDLPGFNIERVSLEFRSTKPRTVQNNLYSGTVMEPENLDLIVTKLKKVVGLEKIGLPKLRDSWSERFYMTENLSPLIEEKDSQFKVQGSKFKVCETDLEAKKTSLSKQTLNLELGTLNAPQAPTLNSEPGTLNSSCFYYFPQPVKARVFFESGEPKALIIKGKREMVRTSGGPWRMDAEWYRAKDWRRDEWDIETETGAVYRVFTDKNGEAFVDGGYD